MTERNLGSFFADVKPSDLHFDGLSEADNLDIKEKIKFLSLLVNSKELEKEATNKALKQLLCKIGSAVFLKAATIVKVKPWATLLKLVGNILEKYVNSDVLPNTEEQMKSALIAVLLRKCVAMGQKLNACYRYLSGLPDPNCLDKKEKRFHMTRMSADIQVFPGYDELAELHVEIQAMIKKTKSLDIYELMTKLDIYCCLTTLYGLFIVFRYAIEKAYGVDNMSILNVLDDQLEKDKQLLSFLYEPTVETVKLCLLFDLDKCEVVAQFVESRQITSGEENFHDKTVEITTAQYPKRWLFARKTLISNTVKCREESKENHEEKFVMKKAPHYNTYTLHPSDKPKYTVYHSTWIGMGTKPARESCEWRIVKIEPATVEETASYLLVLHSKGDKCMYTDSKGSVHVKAYKEGDKKCVWKLEISD